MSLASRFFSSDGPDPSAVDLDGPLSDVCEMFSNVRRQRAIRTLARLDAGEGISLGLLAEHVGAREYGVPESQLGSLQRKRVYVALHQHHLKKLEDVGLLEFDKSRGMIHSTPQTDEAVRFLDVARPMVGGEK